MKAYLLVDIGNTAIKWQYRAGNSVVDGWSLLLDFNIKKLPILVKDADIYLAVVANFSWIEIIKKYYPNNQTHQVSTQKTYKNLHNAYQEISQLGVDRWLNLVAVYEKYPKQAVAILSCGTATTLDVLSENGKHLGGLIMPSLSLMKQSFPQFLTTDPLSQKSLANNTNDAWQLGCQALWENGLLATITPLIKDKKLIVTGGHTQQITPKLQQHTIENNLVLLGLWYYSQNNKT